MGFKPETESLNVVERIAIVSDHAAFDMKAELAAHLRELGHEVLDLGTTSTDSVDYPDYGYRMGQAIASPSVLARPRYIRRTGRSASSTSNSLVKVSLGGTR